jgi:hypothetical protein
MFLGRIRSKTELIVPERASAAVTSLQGRLRANNRRGGGKGRNTGALERNLSITITLGRLLDSLILHTLWLL